MYENILTKSMSKWISNTNFTTKENNRETFFKLLLHQTLVVNLTRAQCFPNRTTVCWEGEGGGACKKVCVCSYN